MFILVNVGNVNIPLQETPAGRDQWAIPDWFVQVAISGPLNGATFHVYPDRQETDIVVPCGEGEGIE